MQKLTSKHVGLGLALHQATHSEALVDMFHAANHTIGIETVRRIDTTIAENIVERFKQNGNTYIPENIIKGHMIQCSLDNIDVLEAMLDGKNTFNSTQMVVWQRGPAPEPDVETDIQIGRPTTIKHDALQAYQKIENASLPCSKRPSPSYECEKLENGWMSGWMKIKKAFKHKQQT